VKSAELASTLAPSAASCTGDSGEAATSVGPGVGVTGGRRSGVSSEPERDRTSIGGAPAGGSSKAARRGAGSEPSR
jgi:hypothetical protein